MTFSVEEVVHLEVKDISPEMSHELSEFLRLRVIRPVVRNGGNIDGHFGGFFNRSAIKEIQTWLAERGARHVEVNRDEDPG